MNRREFIGSTVGVSAALAAGAFVPFASAAPPATVYRSPGCSCCLAWVGHLERAGIKALVRNAEDMERIKNKAGIPEALWSCHTALLAGYVIEGHVPVAEIKRLMRDRPKAIGLSVPGMPVGSPGMEMGDRVDPYEVILFSKQTRKVYARYGS